MADYIMYNDDLPVAHFVFDKGMIRFFEALRCELLPMQIRDTSAEGFSAWLRERAIDLNVVQHRNLVYNLLGSRDKIQLALITHMFSISDCFTCFEAGQFTPRNRLCNPEEQQIVSDYILLSGDTSIRKAAIVTPNASTDGSFAKTWRYENDAWWLYKLQSGEATRSEVEISRVLIDCGWDAAKYCYVDSNRSRVRSLNFVAEGEFFEPYDSFRYAFSDVSDDDRVIMANISTLGEKCRTAWKRILLSDALFLNTDRHMRNFGVIRSTHSGEVLRLAPNFDNNQAYRANPTGRYSPMMLRLYLQAADDEDRANLGQLLNVCADNTYLSEAYRAGRELLKL